MAIAGSLLKQAATVVGKAIKATKKKKDKVGGSVKKQFKKEADFIDKKIVQPAKDRVASLKSKAQPQFIKGMQNPKAMYAGTKAKASEIADAAMNTQAFTKGAKAIQAGTTKAKAGLGKAQGIAGGLADDTMKAIKANPTRALELGGAAVLTGALTASIIKSNSSPEQEYIQKRLSDGRFSTSFAGKNSNIVFSEKSLTQKQVDEVRTQVAILESIIESDDPRKRRSEFLNTVLLLNNKYGISNITGKNLSIIIPPVKKGQMKKLNIEASGNPAAKNFFG